MARAAHDDGLAAALRVGGRAAFVQEWYQQPMWATLRRHPCFSTLLTQRSQGMLPSSIRPRHKCVAQMASDLLTLFRERDADASGRV